MCAAGAADERQAARAALGELASWRRPDFCCRTIDNRWALNSLDRAHKILAGRTADGRWDIQVFALQARHTPFAEQT